MPAVDEIAVAGSGQGGLISLYSAALDDRLKGALVAGYFDRREKPYDEPEDRIVWKRLLHFGDAEIAGMIAPRDLVTAGGLEELACE